MMEFCVCSHSKNYHASDVATDFCGGCYNSGGKKFYHDFQLDNLKYIEDLAKERNLI